ncbi:cytochrome P450 [Streptomyces lunaelactis]|uniref:cytochrome P450 family protein n=1 Tax=Streptomyces lunaelactis TaxID=1535768 RepID=UPI001585C7DC|nr:cytochrome P450 [Streptomyces lunaelactis]NUK11237.1 cytochrome P450 [Streptomyces lunaelactis]NUK73051.1 cytochrome P450 [Streptomyces lunaelactis]NUK80418.1 cytochrome P450 [Streptomyces lunaelactis]NUL13297.1 cytochrome P450 [Streptomyces lunaelactis]NUL26005.1 cytochrome P450 [Streptomyces lunaelactis]
MTIVDLGEYGADFVANPYPYYARLRESGPVHEVRLPNGEEIWLIVGHEEARAALADPRLSKSPATVGGTMLDERVIGPNLLVLDPPDHTRLRRLVAREFTARRVEGLRPRIQQITDGLLDAMLPAGHGDLVDALAFPLPIIVICELLGVPAADREAFRKWSNEVVAPTGVAAEESAIHELAAYLNELIEDKRCAGPTDDLLSALIRTRAEDDDRLSAAELRALAYLLLIAGHETTVNLISNGVRALLTHPGQLAALRADFGLLDGAIEEMLRYDGPVETGTVRFTAAPVPVGDTVIPAGEAVLVGIAAGDHDPDRYPSPDRFDIRRDTQGHLAFGHGIHYCLGAPLARLEARIALRSLLERCPDLALDASAGTLDWLPGMLMRGVRRLPVRW